MLADAAEYTGERMTASQLDSTQDDYFGARLVAVNNNNDDDDPSPHNIGDDVDDDGTYVGASSQALADQVLYDAAAPTPTVAHTYTTPMMAEAMGDAHWHDCSRGEAKRLLRGLPPNTFLLRPNQKQPNRISVSAVASDGKVQHGMIECTDQWRVIGDKKTPPCGTLSELLNKASHLDTTLPLPAFK